MALVDIDGRRWVSSPFGDVEWVRNLRVAGEGIIALGRRRETVRALQLDRDQAAAFFADVLGPYARGRLLGGWLLGSVLGGADILDDPRAAAERHPVFELIATARG